MAKEFVANFTQLFLPLNLFPFCDLLSFVSPCLLLISISLLRSKPCLLTFSRLLRIYFHFLFLRFSLASFSISIERESAQICKFYLTSFPIYFHFFLDFFSIKSIEKREFVQSSKPLNFSIYFFESILIFRFFLSISIESIVLDKYSHFLNCFFNSNNFFL